MAKEKRKIAPQKGSQELAMNTKADLIIYGGAKLVATPKTTSLIQGNPNSSAEGNPERSYYLILIERAETIESTYIVWK